jgi:secondary thiamine-phosphate synthase enzyme
MNLYKNYTLNITTHSEDEMINISGEIEKLLEDSEVINGSITMFVPHTTAAITINENADPDVVEDLLLGLRRISPKDNGYLHNEGNSHAHIKSSMIGVEQTILVENKEMVLGIWQGIYFMEFDGPRTRNLIVRIQDIS